MTVKMWCSDTTNQSGIILSPAATKPMQRSNTRCWLEKQIKNILMHESVVDVPMTLVSENRRYVRVRRGTDFLSSGSAAAPGVVERVRTPPSTQRACYASDRRCLVERLSKDTTCAEGGDGAHKNPNGSQTTNMLMTRRGCEDRSWNRKKHWRRYEGDGEKMTRH